ncbi:MAG: RluA family pseudouridine synthase [Oscillospiraceae bacterium]
MRILEYKITDEHDGKRACDFLRRNEHFSYALIVKLRHSPESLKLDGEFIRTIDRLRAGAVLTVELPETKGSEEPNEDLDIPKLYEDDDIIIFDKPPGVPVHPSKGHQTDTLANYCAAHCPCSKFHVIGRLDMDTSGLVLVAKNSHAAAVLTDSQIEKEYIAVAQGTPPSLSGTIDAPIDDTDPEAHRRFVAEGGRSAVTDYEVFAEDENLFAAKVKPKTGRTHQIRVHFSYMGTPLAGDELYGGSRELISRHALHRSRLSFAHPVTGERLCFCSDPPEDMRKLIEDMENI